MTDALHPRIHELLTELDRTQQAMRAVLASLPPEHANTVVRDDSWSVAQVVEHLLLVEDGTGRLISTLIKQCEGTTDAETDPVLPTLAGLYVTDAVRNPIEAPPSVTPKGEMSLADAMAAQQTARERVMAAFTKGAGRALGARSYPHPILGSLNTYQWGHFLALHQQRHMVQLRSILSQLPV
ncbi:DinB family protein [Gemmatimonas sp.]|jgi:hypothetical protein|uniref:DinB family protein n=1 Tax=Gemmatimonas sp. TaxID=1962908 RepID=UPI0037C1B20F